jgi:hypothetical protein
MGEVDRVGHKYVRLGLVCVHRGDRQVGRVPTRFCVSLGTRIKKPLEQAHETAEDSCIAQLA